MNVRTLALLASLAVAGLATSGRAAESASREVHAIPQVATHAHSCGHWDVWYYGWNGQFWGWHVYGSYHAEFQAIQARNYLWSIGTSSAYYVYHY